MPWPRASEEQHALVPERSLMYLAAVVTQGEMSTARTRPARPLSQVRGTYILAMVPQPEWRVRTHQGQEAARKPPSLRLHRPKRVPAEPALTSSRRSARARRRRDARNGAVTD